MRKGDRVSWAVRGGGTGTVVWPGAPKYGDGLRCGVRDAQGETHWLDPDEVTVLSAKVSEAHSGRSAQD